MKLFKIMNRDGLFSTGGMRPRWSKRGKTWNSIGHLKCHLTQFQGKIPSDWTVIEISYGEPQTRQISISEL